MEHVYKKFGAKNLLDLRFWHESSKEPDLLYPRLCEINDFVPVLYVCGVSE